MLKGYKYRIFPTEDQKDQLQRYFGVNRFGDDYNEWMSRGL